MALEKASTDEINSNWRAKIRELMNDLIELQNLYGDDTDNHFVVETQHCIIFYLWIAY